MLGKFRSSVFAFLSAADTSAVSEPTEARVASEVSADEVGPAEREQTSSQQGE